MKALSSINVQSECFSKSNSFKLIYSFKVYCPTFLIKEGVEMTPSLWLEIIHGRNAELIHLLESNHIEPTEAEEEEPYNICIKESIKCHHNDISKYFINNFQQNEDGNSKYIINQNWKYCNFYFLQNENIYESLCYLFLYDYYSLAKVLLASRDIDINNKVIQNCIFQ